MISCGYLLQTKREVEGSMAKNLFFTTCYISFFPCLSVKLLGLNFRSPFGLCEWFAKYLTIY